MVGSIFFVFEVEFFNIFCLYEPGTLRLFNNTSNKIPFLDFFCANLCSNMMDRLRGRDLTYAFKVNSLGGAIRRYASLLGFSFFFFSV